LEAQRCCARGAETAAWHLAPWAGWHHRAGGVAAGASCMILSRHVLVPQGMLPGLMGEVGHAEGWLGFPRGRRSNRYASTSRNFCAFLPRSSQHVPWVHTFHIARGEPPLLFWHQPAHDSRSTKSRTLLPSYPYSLEASSQRFDSWWIQSCGRLLLPPAVCARPGAHVPEGPRHVSKNLIWIARSSSLLYWKIHYCAGCPHGKLGSNRRRHWRGSAWSRFYTC